MAGGWSRLGFYRLFAGGLLCARVHVVSLT